MSWRMNPARSSSRWLAASASAGSSRKVGMCSCDQRMTGCPLLDGTGLLRKNAFYGVGQKQAGSSAESPAIALRPPPRVTGGAPESGSRFSFYLRAHLLSLDVITLRLAVILRSEEHTSE